MSWAALSYAFPSVINRMPARHSSILRLLGASFFLWLTSCESKVKQEASEAPLSEEPAHPWEITPQSEQTKQGQTIYLQECALCHNEGEEGAPALHQTSEWKERSNKGVDTLIRHAIDGYIGEDGEMPARGGSELSDTEVKHAVLFMLEAVQKK